MAVSYKQVKKDINTLYGPEPDRKRNGIDAKDKPPSLGEEFWIDIKQCWRWVLGRSRESPPPKTTSRPVLETLAALVAGPRLDLQALQSRQDTLGCVMSALPEEILSSILFLLQPQVPEPEWHEVFSVEHELYDSLAAACRVSKTWNRVAVPLLYENVVIWRLKSFRQGPSSNDGQERTADRSKRDYQWNLRALLQTCAQHPHRSSYIKHLRSERWHQPNVAYDWPWDQRTRPDPLRPALVHLQNGVDEDIFQSCEDVIDQLHLSPQFGLAWLDALSTGDVDAEFTLLVALTHESLQTLHVDIPKEFVEGRSYLRDLITELQEAATQYTPAVMPLSMLGTLAVCGHLAPHNGETTIDDFPVYLGDLTPLLGSPSLHTVSIQDAACALEEDLYWFDIGEAESIQPRQQLRSRPHPHVRKLRLSRCAVSQHGLRDVLLAFPNLRDLHIEFADIRANWDWWTDDGTFAHSLPPAVQPELERLAWISDDPYVPRPSNLHALINLRHLTITRLQLLPCKEPPLPHLADILPPNLDELHIIEYALNRFRHVASWEWRHGMAELEVQAHYWMTLRERLLGFLAGAAGTHPRLQCVVLDVSSTMICAGTDDGPPVYDWSCHEGGSRDEGETPTEEEVAGVGWRMEVDGASGALVLNPAAAAAAASSSGFGRRGPGRRFVSIDPHGD